ncbi:MAG: 7,8-didemethyl-8-hydroxy-5-deazariboflavin synthase CofG [Deltaproteobacteria bacterium]|nr:7,8-didemethyl-8-hydroxy-5-deazariboflavin synthase CofG [Deltaproteobacteria bacterium]
MNREQTTAARGLEKEEALALAEAEGPELERLLERAAALRDRGHGRVTTYSAKVFIPLTRYCRNVCGYCTFRREPGREEAGYLEPARVLELARQGRALGCREALFSLGDKPERRYPEAREDLRRLGHESTAGYLARMCRAVLEETGLIPHVNAGVLSREDIRTLRTCSGSLGLMLEQSTERLCEAGGPHAGSPDKRPRARLDFLRLAGEEGVPVTTGLLVGIGETPAERVQSLLEIRELQEEFGHIQEVIVQNFRAKPGISMARHPDAPVEDLLRTLALARLILGGEMNIQAPPNLNGGDPGLWSRLLGAGLNDWGGISPLTPDHINPEAPWPHLEELERVCAAGGFALRERLCVHSRVRGLVHPALEAPLARHAGEIGMHREARTP